MITVYPDNRDCWQITIPPESSRGTYSVCICQDWRYGYVWRERGHYRTLHEAQQAAAAYRERGYRILDILF